MYLNTNANIADYPSRVRGESASEPHAGVVGAVPESRRLAFKSWESLRRESTLFTTAHGGVGR